MNSFLRIQSHEECTHEFLRKIPPTRTAFPVAKRILCDACMYADAIMSITVSRDNCVYNLCTTCRGYNHGVMIGIRITESQTPQTPPSRLQHTANMKQIGFTNLIKIAISRMMRPVPLISCQKHDQCAICIIRRAPHGEICSDCYTPMICMLYRIRRTITCWSCVDLLDDCRRKILDMYLAVLLMG